MTLCHVARFLGALAVEALTVSALLAVSRSGLLDLLDVVVDLSWGIVGAHWLLSGRPAGPAQVGQS